MRRYMLRGYSMEHCMGGEWVKYEKVGSGGGQGGMGGFGDDSNKMNIFINDGEYMSIGSGGTPVHGQSVYKASGPLEVIITPGSNGNININVIWRGEGE